jgi:hypothetical protein
LVEAASEESDNVFWIDDVWVTGILAQKIGLDLVSLNPYYTVYSEHIACCNRELNFWCDFYVGPSNGNSKMIRDFGNHVKRCIDKGCQRRTLLDSIIQTCTVKNPLFLPESGGFGEVIS